MDDKTQQPEKPTTDEPRFERIIFSRDQTAAQMAAAVKARLEELGFTDVGTNVE